MRFFGSAGSMLSRLQTGRIQVYLIVVFAAVGTILFAATLF